jgi:hypothetical protein
VLRRAIARSFYVLHSEVKMQSERGDAAVKSGSPSLRLCWSHTSNPPLHLPHPDTLLSTQHECTINQNPSRANPATQSTTGFVTKPMHPPASYNAQAPLPAHAKPHIQSFQYSQLLHEPKEGILGDRMSRSTVSAEREARNGSARVHVSITRRPLSARHPFTALP